jgi:flagellar basal body rod protein FlgF
MHIYSNEQSNENSVLEEYKLLYTDLVNIQTYGYKSFYNSQLNTATNTINDAQGALQMTYNPFDCAIQGSGFFKIKLENGQAAYTRNGEFIVNAEGEFVTKQGYSLFDPLYLEETFMPQTFKIKQNHSVYVKYADGDGNEKKIGEILTYNIQPNMLEHFSDAIYIIKETENYTSELTFENNTIGSCLEMSNYPLLPTLLRMYYILSIADTGIIPNIEFKKELIKIQIEMCANQNINLEERKIKDNIVTDYLDDSLQYLKDILPFIKYNY